MSSEEPTVTVFGTAVAVLGVIYFVSSSVCQQNILEESCQKETGKRPKPLCVVQFYYTIFLSGSTLHKIQITLATQLPFICTCISISCMSSEVLLRVI